MIVSYTVEHVMRFDYETPVQASVMTLFLCPLRERAQTVHEFSLRTEPEGRLFEFTDPFGNTGHFLDRPRPHARFEVRSRSRVEVGPLGAAPERARTRRVGGASGRRPHARALAADAPEPLRPPESRAR